MNSSGGEPILRITPSALVKLKEQIPEATCTSAVQMLHGMRVVEMSSVWQGLGIPWFLQEGTKITFPDGRVIDFALPFEEALRKVRRAKKGGCDEGKS